MYIIQDKATGNYISSDSFFITKDKIIYSTHTGRADDLEYSHTKKAALIILHNIQSKLNKYGIQKEVHIVETEKENLLKGKLVIQYFPKRKVKIA